MVLCLDPEGFELTHFTLCAVPYKSLLFWCSNSGRLLGIDPHNTRCCRSFEQPIGWESDKETDCFGVCRGCQRICQISMFYTRFSSISRIWELKDYDNEGGGKWYLKHEVSVNQLVSKKLSMAHWRCTTEISSFLSASFSSQWWRYLVLGDWIEGFIMQLAEQNGRSLLWYSSRPWHLEL